jgi:TQXA domain-containing protein
MATHVPSHPARAPFGRRAGRLLLAAVVGCAAVVVSAMPAHAATAIWRGYGAYQNITAAVDGRGVYPEVPTGVMRLEINGVVYAGYCIEFFNDRLDATPYTDVAWTSVQAATAMPNVNWILRNSYPNVSVAALSARIGMTITADEAGAATQAAIWRYTEPGWSLVLDAAASPAVRALYANLTDPAVNVGLAGPPTAPSLTVSPATSAGDAGSLIGPFSVATTGAAMSVSAVAPATVVDAAGAPLASVPAGGSFYVQVPAGSASGSASITVSGDAPVGSGTVFITPGDGPWNQEQVLAEAALEPVTATVSVTWTGTGTTTTGATTTTPTTVTPTTVTPTTVTPTTVTPTTVPVPPTVLGTTTVPTTSGGSGSSVVATTTTVTVLGVDTTPATLPRTGGGDELRPVLLLSLLLLLAGAGLVGAQLVASERRREG